MSISKICITHSNLRSIPTCIQYFFQLTHSLGRYSQRQQLSSSYVTRKYQSGVSHHYHLNHRISSTVIPLIYHQPWLLHYRMSLHEKLFDGKWSLNGILSLYSPSTWAFSAMLLNCMTAKSSSNLTSAISLFISSILSNSLLTSSILCYKSDIMFARIPISPAARGNSFHRIINVEYIFDQGHPILPTSARPDVL